MSRTLMERKNFDALNNLTGALRMPAGVLEGIGAMR